MSEEQNKVPKAGPGRHGPGGGMMPGEKAKDFKGTIKKLMGYMGRYKIALIGVVIFVIGGTVFNIVGPKILGKATTELFNGFVKKVSGNGGIDFTRIGTILLLLLGLYVVSACLSFVQGWLMTLIAIVILPVSAGLIGIVVKFSQKYFVTQQKYLGKINGQVEEIYSGHNIVQAFNREKAAEEK